MNRFATTNFNIPNHAAIGKFFGVGDQKWLFSINKGSLYHKFNGQS